VPKRKPAKKNSRPLNQLPPTPTAEITQLQGIFDLKDSIATKKAAIDFIALHPNDSYGYKVLGSVQLDQGKHAEAINTLKQSISLAPKDSETHYNLANAQRKGGLIKDAEKSYRKAINFNPENFPAFTDLGALLKELQQYSEAEKYTRQALKLCPSDVSAHINLGGILKNKGQLLEAENAIKNAIQYKPDSAEAMLNLGAIKQDLGQLQEAKAITQQALTHLPDNIYGLTNLSIIQKDLNEFNAAVESVSKALDIQPNLVAAWSQLSTCLRELGKHTESQNALQKTIDLNPETSKFRLRQTLEALPIVSSSVQESKQALKEYSLRVDKLHQWLKKKPERINEFRQNTGIAYPFYLAYRHGNHCDVLSRYGDLLALSFEDSKKKHITFKKGRSKIRLLIITAFIRRHSAWDIILKGLIQHIDRSRFELLIYHFGKLNDNETAWAQKKSDIWRDRTTSQGNAPSDWLSIIEHDQPDVIYYPEIGMDSATALLAAQRLAPLQIASWGHPITSGLKTIDIFLSGELIESTTADSHYREKLVRLPGTGCCTEFFYLEPSPSPKLEIFLERLTAPRFVIPQSHFKFDPADDWVYAEIAEKFGSCTFLFPESKNRKWALPQVLARIGQHFRAKGLNPDNYLKTFPWLNKNRFFSLLDRCEIFLDCPGFSGYTTAWQALHRGLPVVTLEGPYMRQRLAAGLLRQIDMTDTIAQDLHSYVDIAVRLATESSTPESYSIRRDDLKKAMLKADQNIKVIRAFEETLINELSSHNTLPLAFDNRTQSDKQNMIQKNEYPWQKLDADLHFHSLNHHYAPTGLLQLIDKKPIEVLDLGCFCGGSGQWLKNKFPEVRVTGIEMLEKAANEAQKIYDEVHIDKFEAIDTSQWKNKFNAIIAADVLEHMYNPWSTLQQLKPLIAEGGAIYISLPNIRNLNILMGLANGEWNYAESGILDITHIRFFTKTQALEMLEQTGWKVSHITTNPDSRLSSHFQNKDLNSIDTITAGKLKLESINKEDVLELMALQFYIRAVPK